MELGQAQSRRSLQVSTGGDKVLALREDRGADPGSSEGEPLETFREEFDPELFLEVRDQPRTTRSEKRCSTAHLAIAMLQGGVAADPDG
jgi:hypothetical protein